MGVEKTLLIGERQKLALLVGRGREEKLVPRRLRVVRRRRWRGGSFGQPLFGSGPRGRFDPAPMPFPRCHCLSSVATVSYPPCAVKPRPVPRARRAAENSPGPPTSAVVAGIKTVRPILDSALVIIPSKGSDAPDKSTLQ